MAVINDETEQKYDKELKKHGGQDWKLLTNYVEDFSVTTNGLSTPLSGINAMKEALVNIDHYPPLDNEPALTDLATFIWRDESSQIDRRQFNKCKSSLILGSGASELVDIIMRVFKENNVKSFRPGPSIIQYKDYERCAKQNKFKILDQYDDSADLLSIVNPTNPTGDFMKVDVIKKYIEDHAKENSFVVVDESMIFWYGENWRAQSLSSQYEWINDIYNKKGVTVFINYSWTKIWKCCGIRIGSIVAPTVDNNKYYKQIKRKQCPWSVNSLGLAFISAASKDDEYMKKTWKITKLWRAKMVNEIAEIFNGEQDGINDDDNKPKPKPIKIYGENFLSWIWCDTFDDKLAKLCTDTCREYGVPIRHAIHGYKQATCIRFGVRKPSSCKVLYNALRTAKNKYYQQKKL